MADAARVQACAEAVERAPDSAQAWNDLGNATLDLGHPGEAEQCFRHAIELAPAMAEARYNLGRLMHLGGRLPEALAGYEQALALAPRLAPAAYNRAILLAAIGRADDSAAAYRDLLSWAPDHADAWNNLGKALREQGLAEAAVAAFNRAADAAPADAEIASNRLFALLHAESTDSASLRAAQAAYGRLYAAPARRHGNRPDPERRLRIGFVSPDLREHPVGRFVEPLFDRLDPARAEVFCYPTAACDDDLARRLRAVAAGWRPLSGVGSREAAAVIGADGIDVLVDLAGHTAGNRLDVFAEKPAPVQLGWLGYLGGTGLAAIDGRLTDAFCDPPGIAEAWQIEALWRLPRCQWCYRPPAVTPTPLGRLAGDGVVFGSFNNVAKLSDGLLAAWGRLLRRLPESRLLVAGAPEGEARRRIAEALAVAESRLVFAPRCAPADYFALYRQVDIALDSHPYAGGTTTCDALWMGVPVVAWAGGRPCARSGASLLAAVGLADWVAATADEYVALAANWARNPAELSALKAGLRARMQQSPLMDEADFARAWLAVVRSAWQHWCAAQRGSE